MTRRDLPQGRERQQERTPFRGVRFLCPSNAAPQQGSPSLFICVDANHRHTNSQTQSCFRTETPQKAIPPSKRRPDAPTLDTSVSFLCCHSRSATCLPPSFPSLSHAKFFSRTQSVALRRGVKYNLVGGLSRGTGRTVCNFSQRLSACSSSSRWRCRAICSSRRRCCPKKP